eukprot:m.21054 g.21054  ORF g.21054 m.21054 type:complete len:468 (+) comp13240_c0_seq2:371-1774(+)
MLDFFRSEAPPVNRLGEDEDAPLLASSDDEAAKPKPIQPAVMGVSATKPPLWRKFTVVLRREERGKPFGFDLGTVLTPVDGDPNIHRVVRLSPDSAAEGKLEVGDCVISVNGVQVEQEGHEGLVSVIAGKDDLTLIVKRKDSLLVNGMTQRMVKAQQKISEKTGEIKFVKSEVMASDVGRRCKVEEFGFGTIKYLGKFHKNGFNRAGIDLDLPIGKHSGNVDGYEYFTCPEKHGILIKLDKVHVMRWPHEIKASEETPPEVLGKITPFKFFDDKADDSKPITNIQRSSAPAPTSTGWFSSWFSSEAPRPPSPDNGQQVQSTFTFAPADEVTISQSAEISRVSATESVEADQPRRPQKEATTYEFGEVDSVANEDFAEVAYSRTPNTNNNVHTVRDVTPELRAHTTTTTTTNNMNTTKNATTINTSKAKAALDPFEQSRKQLDFADFSSTATSVVSASSPFDPVQIVA